MKICCNCKQELDLTMFCKHKNKKDGLNLECKFCIAKRQAKPENKQRAKERIKQRQTDPQERLKLMLGWAKARCKHNKTEFSITEIDLPIPELCPYLKVPFDYDPKKNHNWNAMSIDRIDSSKGYIPGNVQIITELANRMKSNATQEQLNTFAKSILNK